MKSIGIDHESGMSFSLLVPINRLGRYAQVQGLPLYQVQGLALTWPVGYVQVLGLPLYQVMGLPLYQVQGLPLLSPGWYAQVLGSSTPQVLGLSPLIT